MAPPGDERPFCEIHTKQLAAIDVKLDTVITSIATINQRCLDKGKTINGHGMTLYGPDGAGGIVVKQNEVNLRLKNMNGVNKDRKDWLKSIIAPVIAALLISVIFAAIVIWKTH